MCFSATASFTAAGIIGLMSIACLRKIKSGSLLLLALTPLLFAFQQFNEGLNWLYAGTDATTVLNFSKHLYLFFALIVWPIWFPLIFLTAEKDHNRKKTLLFLLATGVTVSCVIGFHAFRHEIPVGIENNTIYYDYVAVHYMYTVGAIYAVCIILPGFISSLPFSSAFSFLQLFSLIFTQIAYSFSMTSVWCFFGALMTIFLYKIIKDTQKT